MNENGSGNERAGGLPSESGREKEIEKGGAGQTRTESGKESGDVSRTRNLITRIAIDAADASTPTKTTMMKISLPKAVESALAVGDLFTLIILTIHIWLIQTCSVGLVVMRTLIGEGTGTARLVRGNAGSPHLGAVVGCMGRLLSPLTCDLGTGRGTAREKEIGTETGKEIGIGREKRDGDLETGNKGSKIATIGYPALV